MFHISKIFLLNKLWCPICNSIINKVLVKIQYQNPVIWNFVIETKIKNSFSVYKTWKNYFWPCRSFKNRKSFNIYDKIVLVLGYKFCKIPEAINLCHVHRLILDKFVHLMSHQFLLPETLLVFFISRTLP